MAARTLWLVIPLIVLLTVVPLLASCANPEEQEALGTPDPDVTLGVLPETGGQVTTVPGPGEATASISTTGPLTSSLPVIGGVVTGTTPGTTAGLNQIQVLLQEYTVDMVDTIPAGLVVFQITNDGNWEHGFVLTGNGIMATLEKPLAPDELGEIQVELPPGIYEIYCPIAGHSELGMRLELAVTEP